NLYTSNNMEYRKIHLINENGDRKVVETRNSREKFKRLNESTNTSYHIDIDWYLNNGYVEISEARRIIEGQYYEKD
ncbi:MAG: hypothetical protein IIT65_05675, partial [Lachnospiraceae bacterium]|nr:hypothetical protein [Lachnospiraceae bacterium]